MRAVDTYTHFFLSFTFSPPPPRARMCVSARPRGVKGERRERSPRSPRTRRAYREPYSRKPYGAGKGVGRYYHAGTERTRPREQPREDTEFLSRVRAHVEAENAWMQ